MPKQRRISWRPSAREDLADILDRISEDSPQAAENLFDAIERSVQILPRFPLLFRESERMPGMRQIPVFGSFLVDAKFFVSPPSLWLFISGQILRSL